MVFTLLESCVEIKLCEDVECKWHERIKEDEGDML